MLYWSNNNAALVNTTAHQPHTCMRQALHVVCFTVWKFKTISVSKILREIVFSEYNLKITIIRQCLWFELWFFAIWGEGLNSPKKIDFTQNLSSKKILKFPHSVLDGCVTLRVELLFLMQDNLFYIDLLQLCCFCQKL